MTTGTGVPPPPDNKPRIIICDTDEVEKYDEEIEKILQAIGHPDALVTDESTFYDFTDFGQPIKEQHDQVDEWMKPLGLDGFVTGSTYLHEAAKLLRQRGVPQ